MENVILSIGLGLLGLIAGSFAGASVWRIRASQLQADEKNGDKVTASDKRDVEKLQKKPLHSDRSVCLHCGHELRWYDLIPLVSWITLAGKCRYCHKKIGRTEPIIEIAVATFFVVSYFMWPTQLVTWVDIAPFVIWLVAGVAMAILFVYDAKWMLLPDSVVFPLIGLGTVKSGLVVATSVSPFAAFSSIVFSCLILSGLYYLLYAFSGHKWVGFGDVKLGLALALLLADWQLAVLCLFLANFIGTLLFLPSMLVGKIGRQSRIPFGPLLIMGWALSGIFGSAILSWYLGFAL